MRRALIFAPHEVRKTTTRLLFPQRLFRRAAQHFRCVSVRIWRNLIRDIALTQQRRVFKALRKFSWPLKRVPRQNLSPSSLKHPQASGASLRLLRRGRISTWDSIIVDDIPGELIGWKSAEGADIANSSHVEFRDAQAGRGTEVTATILYDPPAGALGKIVAKLFQKEPKIQSRRDLRRFKQLMETGEISTSQNRIDRATSH